MFVLIPCYPVNHFSVMSERVEPQYKAEDSVLLKDTTLVPPLRFEHATPLPQRSSYVPLVWEGTPEAWALLLNICE